MSSVGTVRAYSIDELRALVEPIAIKYGVDRVRLFGSRARGDNGEDSDYDFCVDPGEIKGLFGLGGFLCGMESVLGINIDLISANGMGRPLADEVNRDAVVIYEK